MNENAANNYKNIMIQIYDCIEGPNKKYSDEKARKEFLSEYYILVYPDYYIDVSDYEVPNKAYINTMAVSLTAGSSKFMRLNF
jgi:hypothetical protein